MDGPGVVDTSQLFEFLDGAVAIARLVRPETYAVGPQVDEICGTGAVDVGQLDPRRIETPDLVEAWGVDHDDLGAEAAVPEVGPVADLAVADAHEVRQPVPAHVGEKDGAVPAGRHQPRSIQFVGGLASMSRRPVPVACLTREPTEDFVLGDQDVSMAIAVQNRSFGRSGRSSRCWGRARTLGSNPNCRFPRTGSGTRGGPYRD